MGLWNAVGGFVGGLFGGAAKNEVDYGQQWRYKKKELELQQEYNERNMAIQNDYALAQWNRENEYNDPSAVAQRYRKAGISPQAALTGACIWCWYFWLYDAAFVRFS